MNNFKDICDGFYDCVRQIQTLKTQIKCLESNMAFTEHHISNLPNTKETLEEIRNYFHNTSEPIKDQKVSSTILTKVILCCKETMPDRPFRKGMWVTDGMTRVFGIDDVDKIGKFIDLYLDDTLDIINAMSSTVKQRNSLIVILVTKYEYPINLITKIANIRPERVYEILRSDSLNLYHQIRYEYNTLPSKYDFGKKTQC